MAVQVLGSPVHVGALGPVHTIGMAATEASFSEF